MTHLRTPSRSLPLALLALAILFGPAPLALGESDAASLPGDSVTITPPPTVAAIEVGPRVITHPAGDADLMRLGSWGLARFEAAQLDTPPIEIHLHRDRDACRGHRGLFNAGEMRVDVCVTEPLVVLHEIAHAWNHVNVPGDVESTYVAAGGFGSWDAPETPWHDRGSEDAADTIAWALMDDPIAMPTPDGPIAQLDARYRLLTGNDAPRVVRP